MQTAASTATALSIKLSVKIPLWKQTVKQIKSITSTAEILYIYELYTQLGVP